MNANSTPGYSAPVVVDAEEMTALDIMIVLAENKERIIGAGLLVALAAAGLSLLIADSFTGRAQIMPPQNQSGSSALLGQLGALSGMAGASLGIKSSSDTYVGMLNSRRVSDSLVARFELQKAYGKSSLTDARNALRKATVIAAGKDGLIVIEVSDHDPKQAAALANGYVDELQKLTQTFAVSEASQRRLFFERQLIQAKRSLSEAEVALKVVQEKTGLIAIGGQAEGIIRAAAELKAQIAAKEVALGAMRAFATTSNPEYITIEREVAGLRAQLTKVETGMNMGKGDISVATSKVPEAGLEFVRRVRDVKYHEAIFELLAKQFEIAKIDEAKEGSMLQVLDSATEPDKKSGPNRTIIVVLAALSAIFLTICWAIIREISSRLRRDVAQAPRLKDLRHAARWGSRKKAQ